VGDRFLVLAHAANNALCLEAQKLSESVSSSGNVLDVDFTRSLQRIASRILGRRHEIQLILAAVAAGRDLLLEGAPGTSKSTLLGAITSEWGIPLVFVEGNAELTPSRLVGHHDPVRVLKEGYLADNFVDGPLVEAMRTGSFLFIEEFNRTPDETLNTLLTAMAERVIAVPRVGQIKAKATFRIVATMNPFDNLGTTRLSTSIRDRMCRLSIDYQSAGEEIEIVRLRSNTALHGISTGVRDALIGDSVQLTRATRVYPSIRQGASVRGAIDLVLVAERLFALREIRSLGNIDDVSPNPTRYKYLDAIFDAMVLALSGRIRLDEASEFSPELILRQIWERHFVLNPSSFSPG
jgi:MoxR-like ATPase